MGIPNRIHYIVEDKCIGCGGCFDVCQHGAVILADAPAVPVATVRVEDDSVSGLFSSGTFKGWHDGKGLLQK